MTKVDGAKAPWDSRYGHRIYHNRGKTAWLQYEMDSMEFLRSADAPPYWDEEDQEVPPPPKHYDDEDLPRKDKSSLARQYSERSTVASEHDYGGGAAMDGVRCAPMPPVMQLLKSEQRPTYDMVCEAVAEDSNMRGKSLTDVLGCVDAHGWPLLVIAAQRRSAEAVKALLDLGAEVDCREPASGWTPLMFAAVLGETEIVKLLLGAGAAVDEFAVPHDWNALCAAILAGYEDIARMLLDAGASLRAIQLRHPDLAERYADFAGTLLSLA